MYYEDKRVDKLLSSCDGYIWDLSIGFVALSFDCVLYLKVVAFVLVHIMAVLKMDKHRHKLLCKKCLEIVHFACILVF